MKLSWFFADKEPALPELPMSHWNGLLAEAKHQLVPFFPGGKVPKRAKFSDISDAAEWLRGLATNAWVLEPFSNDEWAEYIAEPPPAPHYKSLVTDDNLSSIPTPWGFEPDLTMVPGWAKQDESLLAYLRVYARAQNLEWFNAFLVRAGEAEDVALHVWEGFRRLAEYSRLKTKVRQLKRSHRPRPSHKHTYLEDSKHIIQIAKTPPPFGSAPETASATEPKEKFNEKKKCRQEFPLPVYAESAA